MATSNFHARLKRIEQSQSTVPQATIAHFRTPGVAGVATAKRRKPRARLLVPDHLFSIAIGLVMGALLTVAFIGLGQENAPWGPGTWWQGVLFYPIMAGFALAPIFLVAALLLASRKPAFALYALGYITGIVGPLVLYGL